MVARIDGEKEIMNPSAQAGSVLHAVVKDLAQGRNRGLAALPSTTVLMANSFLPTRRADGFRF